MSAVKRYLEQQISELSSTTGYDEDFLMDAYIFYMGLGLTFEEFEAKASNHELDDWEFVVWFGRNMQSHF